MRQLLATIAFLAASPAFAQAADSDIPPPPYLADSIMVLFGFVAIFVAAAWSLAVFVQAARAPRRSRPRRYRHN